MLMLQSDTNFLRVFLLPLVVLLCWGQSAAAGGLSGSRPNIIIVMTDDQGYADLSSSGHPYIKTPNIDRLREQSTRLEDFHASSSCAPTRAAIMSGVHPFKVGVTHTIFHRELMALDQKILPQVLQEAGYTSGIFGKWHLGDSDPYQPHNRGFDEALIHGSGILGAGIRSNGSYVDPILRHNGQFVQTKGFCTDVFFSHGMAWIKAQHDAKRPFFALISTNAPHGPFNATEADLERYAGIGEENDRGFYALISNIDDNVGKLMQKLAEWGMEEDTILIFMTDNGSVRSSVYNAGMKGGKTSINEGGDRVPFFIRWKGTLEAGRDINTMTRHYDLMPTFADLAGLSSDSYTSDGRSLLPLLEDPKADWADRTTYFHKGRWGNPDSKHEKHRRNPGADNNKFRTFAVRNEKWRLTVRSDLDRGAELINVQEDPGEKNDLSQQYPEVVAGMLEAYSKWWDETRPLMVNEDADIKESKPTFRSYYMEQKKAGEVPVLVINQ